MTNLLRYSKKTYVNYIVVASIIAVQLLINVGTNFYDYLTQGTVLTAYDIFNGFTFMLMMAFGALAVSQGIVLIASTFDFNKLFGLSNKKSIRDTIKFVFIQTILLSIGFNIVMIIAIPLNSKVVPSMMFGMRWDVFDQPLQKLFLAFLFLYTLYAVSMWLTVGYKKYGVLTGLTRTFLSAAYVFNQGEALATYADWGINGPLNIIILIVVATLATTHLYFDMLKYERRSS